MVSKKIIAICQYGGEFQASKDGTLNYYGGENHAVFLYEDARLTEFKKDLAETYQCSVDDMLIKYFLPGNRKNLITISQDKDLKRMVDFFNDSDQVEIFVMHERDIVVVNRPSLPASRSSRTTDSEAAVVAAVSTSHSVDPTETDQTVITYEMDSPDTVIDDPTGMDMMIEPDPLDTVINETTAMEPCTSIIAITEAEPCSSINDDQNDDKHPKVATQWENTITGVDQRFSSIPEFRQALHKYCIAHGINITFKRNNLHCVLVKCKSEGCPWHINAGRVGKTQLVRIRKMNKTHTCSVTASAVQSGLPSRVWVGSIVTEKLKNTPNYKPFDIISDVKQAYGIELNYSQARRAKATARRHLQGSYEKAYSQLPFFCEKIIETNPGSVATFTTKEDSSFHRLFVSYHACVAGFLLGCRPLLFLDSVPLNSKYRGKLLGAIAADGDDGVFPVAFAVVDEETDENWSWFLTELKSAVPTSQKISFVADPQKGLEESLVEVFNEECHHGYSLGHVAEKLEKDLKGLVSRDARRLIVQDFYAAAYASNVEAFQQCAENINAISPEAYKWVISNELEHWANAFFKGERYNHMPSNFGQLFYNWVSDANELPITQMIDVLRGKIMQLIHTRRVDSSKWVTRLTPTVEEKLKNEALKAQSFQVQLTQGNTFEVQSESVDVVNIDDWNCTCKGWHGLPCCHVVAVCKFIGGDLYVFCSAYFTSETFRKTYAESIHPVPNIEMSRESELSESLITVTPPPTQRTPGRPKMKQAELVKEASSKRAIQCSKCKGPGHNKRKCNEVQ